MSIIAALSSGIDAIIRWVVTFLLAGIFLVVIGTIILRQFFDVHFIGSYDVSRLFFIWGVFLGASIAYRQEMHTKFTIVLSRLSSAGQVRLGIAINLLCLGLLSVIVVPSLRLVHSARIQTLPASDINAVWLYLPVTVGTTVMILHGVHLLIRDVHVLRDVGQRMEHQ